jgi:DNA invertase Pin-like site-specific DNA recombinase
MSTRHDQVVAYSYVRFSHPDQAKGNSLQRQTEAAAEWCARNGAALDEMTTLHDLGKSAFTGAHRRNPDRHALAGFLKLIEADKVPRGSYLVIENLDRLSREEEVPACHLLTGILMAGVRVVQLKPGELVLTDKSNGFDIMRAVMELSRGHGESAIKSERVGGAWAEKKRRARSGESQVATRRMGEGRKAMTLMLPLWVAQQGGRLVLVPERAATVRLIYELAAGGWGITGILRKLSAEKVPAFGKGAWSRPYIYNILRDRRAVGELQPRFRDGKPDGDPIPGYYPACVTEAVWQDARVAMLTRDTGQKVRRRAGRHSEHGINLFEGLIFNALDGDAYYCATKKEAGKPVWRRNLITARSTTGKGPALSFPYPAFEAAILTCMREIDPAEILPGNGKSAELAAKSADLARVESRLSQVGAELDHGSDDVRALAESARRLELRKKELVADLAAIRREAAHPQAESWGEFRCILDVIHSAPDPEEARLRLRSVLRRVVDSVWLLVVPRGRNRLCAAQVWFTGGKEHRDYLILHQSARGNGKGREEGHWHARSLPPAAAKGVSLDLRRRAEAEQLATTLATIAL